MQINYQNGNMEEKANIIEAFSEMAPRYEQVVDSELNRFWGWSYSGFIKILLASTPIQPDDIILDVATGTGVIPSLLEKAGHPHSQIHGLDITMSMLNHARRRLEEPEWSREPEPCLRFGDGYALCEIRLHAGHLRSGNPSYGRKETDA